RSRNIRAAGTPDPAGRPSSNLALRERAILRAPSTPFRRSGGAQISRADVCSSDLRSRNIRAAGTPDPAGRPSSNLALRERAILRAQSTPFRGSGAARLPKENDHEV